METEREIGTKTTVPPQSSSGLTWPDSGYSSSKPHTLSGLVEPWILDLKSIGTGVLVSIIKAATACILIVSQLGQRGFGVSTLDIKFYYV